MKNCSNCGKSCEDNLFFCPYCGKFFDAAAPKPEKKPESEIHPEPESEPESEIHPEPESEPESETNLPRPFENTSSSPTYSKSSGGSFFIYILIGFGILGLLFELFGIDF